MLTEFQKRKLTHVFGLFDNDHSAHVDKSDLDRVVENLAGAIDAKAGSAGHRILEARYGDLWKVLEGIDADRDGRVTLDEWLRAMEAITGSEHKYDQVFGQMVDQVFDLLDHDGDSQVTSDEFVQWLGANNVSMKSARDAFRKIDLDHDGILSKDEMTYLMLDFFYSDDPKAPGNWLFGGLG